MDDVEKQFEIDREARRKAAKANLVASLRMFKRMMAAPVGSPGETTYAEKLADLLMENRGC